VVTGKRSGWKTLVVVLVLAGAAAAALSGVIRRRFLARNFPVDVLRDLTYPFSGRLWAEESEAGGIPPRTGKVILIVPAMAHVRKRTDYVTNWECPGFDLRPGETFPPRIHPAWYEVSSSIRASTPDEVDTVVVCEQDTDVVGYYAAAPKYGREILMTDYAHVRKCRLKVFDRASGEFLGIHLVKGAVPKETVAPGERQYGERPDVAGVIERMLLR
jgi:hypothetical protein